MKTFKQLVEETVVALGSKEHMHKAVKEYSDAEDNHVRHYEDFGASHSYTKKANDHAKNKLDHLYHHFSHCLPKDKGDLYDDDDLHRNHKKFVEKHYKSKD